MPINRPNGFRQLIVDNVKYYWRLGKTNLNIRKHAGPKVIIPYVKLFNDYGHPLQYKSGSILDNKAELPFIITPKVIAGVIRKFFKE